MPWSGQMKERVSFGARGGVDDGYGNTVPGEFETKFERRAAYLMRPGSEAVQAARLEGKQPVTMIVRRDAQTLQITSEWRVVDRASGVEFAITAPPADLDRRRQFLTIQCIAGEVA